MKIHFLGSGASEGIPNPFCMCSICKKSRQKKGKDIRTHSSIIIDDSMQIDLSPEYMYQVIRDGVDTTRIKSILFTHTHLDHFSIGHLMNRLETAAFNIKHSISIYGNDIAIREILRIINFSETNRFDYNHFIPFISKEIDGGTVTPLLANHSKKETCLLLYIEKNGKAILYGHDSGWFPQVTWEWLNGRSIDLTILECTLGYNNNAFTDGHMSIETVLEIQKKLINEKNHHKNSQIIVSHLSHHNKFFHEDLVNIFRPYQIEVAYDGLIKYL